MKTNDTQVALCEVRGPLTDLLQKLSGEEGQLIWAPALNRFLRKENPWAEAALAPVPSGEFLILVDYGMSLEKMIAAGSYDWRNDDITPKRFPFKGEGKVEFEARLFHFNRDISSENAVQHIKDADPQNPWEPAKAEHTLAFGAKYPQEQRKYPIIGLGSVCEVNLGRLVLLLYSDSSERRLSLDLWVAGWDSYYRFLAVRKKSQTLAS